MRLFLSELTNYQQMFKAKLFLFFVWVTQFVYGQEIPLKGYELVWSDEFEQGELDESKWRHRSLGERRDAINIKEAIEIHPGGYLIIRTEKVADQIFTGMISTQNKFMPTYGYFETRVYLPREKGLWAAFWLQSPTFGKVIDDMEASGAEIDIFEYLGNNKRRIQHALHWNGYDENLESRSQKVRERQLRKGWHTFGLLWTADEYVYYVNGEENWRISEAVSQRSQYIILSVEVGEWAGKIKRADLPENFVVDYVRVYQEKENQNIENQEK